MRLRPVLRLIHLWLGLALGVPFLVLAFTGAALVFYLEIDAALNPDVRVHTELPAPGWDSPVWDRALAAARARWPGEGVWSFEVSGEPGAVPARYYEHDGHHGDSFLLVWFSPDGARVLRTAAWGETLMTWFYDVHRNLLAGDRGNYVVGWLGVAALIPLMTGLAVWWPRGSWRKALAFKRRAAPTRRLYDLHKILGLSSVLLLLILSATGALLGLPSEKNWILEKTLAPVVPVPAPQSIPGAGPPITVTRALAAARAALPDARLAWVDVPGGGTGVFRIRAQVPGDPTRRFPQSYVFVDQYSGEVLAVHDAREGTASSTVSVWIRPLHDASVGGLATRILGVLAGLSPAALFVTGLLRWRRTGNMKQEKGIASMRVRLMMALIAALAAGAAGLWFGARTAENTAAPTAPVETRPERRDFSLTDSNGERVSLATYRGKWMLMFFGFTSCPEACPLAMQLVSSALGGMGAAAKDIQPIFVSIDPERDTPAVLKEYLAHFSGDIAGLSGTPAETAAVAAAYGVYYRKRALDGDYTMDHSTALYLVAPDGRYVRPFRADVAPAQLAADLAAAVAAAAVDTVDTVDTEVIVKDAWVRATPGAATVSAGYAVIANRGETDDVLTGVKTPVAGMTRLHASVGTDGVMRMDEVSALAIPAGTEVALKPGGYHVMIMDLETPLNAGAEIPLTFTFRKRGDVRVGARVMPVAATGGGSHERH